MKLKLSVLLFAFGIFFNAQMADYYIPQNKNNLVRNELKGNVKSTTTTAWKMVVKFGDPVKSTKVKTSEEFYNKNGNYEKRMFSEDFGKSTYTYFYNINGAVDEIKVTPVKDYPTRYTFIYNAEGKLLKRICITRKMNLLIRTNTSMEITGLQALFSTKGTESNT